VAILIVAHRPPAGPCGQSERQQRQSDYRPRRRQPEAACENLADELACEQEKKAADHGRLFAVTGEKVNNRQSRSLPFPFRSPDDLKGRIVGRSAE
jgi:hypothetical protein